MDSSDKIFKILFEIGLNKYEAKIYLSLVTEGIATAKTISDITGIPYGKVYEIINTLSHKGFVMILPSKPMKYRAVSPQQAIKFAKNEIKGKIEEREKKIIEQLEPAFEESKNFAQPKSTFMVINGRSNVVKKTEELIKKAKNNINLQCGANSISRLVLHKEELKEAHERGVKISVAGVIDRSNQKEIGSLLFCNPKIVSRSLNNFVSIDGQECMVVDPVPDDDNIVYGRDIGMHISSNSFTEFLDNFFESNFKMAKQSILSPLVR